MELHLFSTPGPGDEISWVVEACRPYLEGRTDPTVAYLPQASLYAERWLDRTQKSFKGLARIEMIETETMELAEMQAILRRAALAYIPGGNTFLLSHRLSGSRLMPGFRQKVQNGLPVVAFSAGSVACGPNSLTSNDLNMVATAAFDSLNLAPFNLNVHYADEAAKDNWLMDYRSFHDNPVVMLEDGAYLKVEGKTTTLVRGAAWLWRAGQEKQRLRAGEIVRIQ